MFVRDKGLGSDRDYHDKVERTSGVEGERERKKKKSDTPVHESDKL